jgi:hypothetical protein
MNLDGIRAMKLTNLRPRYILLFPSSDEAYSSILDDHDLSEEERENALATYEEFGNINREKPGYFDMLIPSDNEVESYEILRQLVTDFLGVEHFESYKRADSRDSFSLSTPQLKQKRADELLEAMRHATPNLHVR